MSGRLGLDCILGADFVAGTGLVLDLEDGTGYFKFKRSVRVPLVDSLNNCDEVWKSLALLANQRRTRVLI